MEAVKSQGADLLRGRDVEDCEGGIDLQNEMLQLEEKWAKVRTADENEDRRCLLGHRWSYWGVSPSHRLKSTIQVRCVFMRYF